MTRRSNRYNILKRSGFLPFEARQYSKIPMYSNVLRYVIVQRRRDYRNAGKPSINSKKWIEQIAYEYEAKDWEFGEKAGAWRQYREYEEIWKYYHPNKKDKWQSPNKKRSKQRYRALNRDLILEQKARYRERHRDKIREYAREYRIKKRDLFK